MGTSTKILIGALITALLAWLTYSGMCTAGNGGVAGAAGSGAVAGDSSSGTGAADGTNSTGSDTTEVTPASAEVVEACQADINNLMASKTIEFQSGSGYVAENNPVVLEIAAELKKCAGTQIEVQGHTSLTGTAETNQNISQLRADNVVKALVAAGVPQGQLTAKGYGATQPLVNARTSAANTKNQRTVLSVTSAAAATEGQ